MRLQEPRPGLYEAILTAQELSLLLAGARMALKIMEAQAEGDRTEASTALRRVLDDFDRAVQHLHEAVSAPMA